MKLNGFSYVVQHLPGEQNVWADMLNPWADQTVSRVSVAVLKSCRTLLLAPKNPGASAEHDWPTLDDVKRAQQRSSPITPDQRLMKDGIL